MRKKRRKTADVGVGATQLKRKLTRIANLERGLRAEKKDISRAEGVDRFPLYKDKPSNE